MPTINPTTTNTPNNPYHEVPFLPLENREQTTRHGAQFFSNVKQLSVGFGSKVFRVDRDGMWAGAEDFASAPWKVDWDGNMTASSITISGYVATGGSLADIGAGNITETYIGSNAITAGKISVNDLEAISADLGDITAGSLDAVTITGTTITGSTLTTASSGQRVILTSTLAAFYNLSGTNIVDTYAGSNSYIIDGQTSSSSIVFNCGSSGAVLFQDNSTSVCQIDSNGISPWTSNAVDLGNILKKWRDLWVNGDFEYHTITQPIVYHGRVSGTSNLDNNNTFSISNPSTGRYTVTHSFGHTNYTVQVTPDASVVKNITIDAQNSNDFRVRISNLSDALEDNDFFYVAYEKP